jgi:hypothetical protein
VVGRDTGWRRGGDFGTPVGQCDGAMQGIFEDAGGGRSEGIGDSGVMQQGDAGVLDGVVGGTWGRRLGDLMGPCRAVLRMPVCVGAGGFGIWASCWEGGGNVETPGG